MKKYILIILVILAIFLCSCNGDKKININDDSDLNSSVTKIPSNIDETNTLAVPEYIDQFGERLAPYYHIEWKEELSAKNNDGKDYTIQFSLYTNIDNKEVDSVCYFEQEIFDDKVRQKILSGLYGLEMVYNNDLIDYPKYKIEELIKENEDALTDAKEKLDASIFLTEYEKTDYENRVTEYTTNLKQYKELFETAPDEWRKENDFSRNEFW